MRFYIEDRIFDLRVVILRLFVGALCPQVTETLASMATGAFKLANDAKARKRELQMHSEDAPRCTREILCVKSVKLLHHQEQQTG